MSLNIAIDPANASAGSQGALPDGIYPMKIVDAADKVSKKGNRMIEVVLETDDAKAQRVWHYFNLFHANPDIQRIALSEFTQLGMAIGVAKVDNTDELIGRQLSVTSGGAAVVCLLLPPTPLHFFPTWKCNEKLTSPHLFRICLARRSRRHDDGAMPVRLSIHVPFQRPAKSVGLVSARRGVGFSFR